MRIRKKRECPHAKAAMAHDRTVRAIAWAITVTTPIATLALLVLLAACVSPGAETYAIMTMIAAVGAMATWWGASETASEPWEGMHQVWEIAGGD